MTEISTNNNKLKQISTGIIYYCCLAKLQDLSNYSLLHNKHQYEDVKTTYKEMIFQQPNFESMNPRLWQWAKILM